ncbi:MAG: hypothetical protein JXO51_06035 [Candidatus Aminicenantes bacterium]|nr:hypothetical protein [Candidatus Aminicenantes bacterium]
MKKTIIMTAMLFTAFEFIAAQQLTIVSPNGGETLVSGTPHAITWNYSGLGGDETVIIALEGASDYGPIAYSKVSQGSYSWLAGQKMDGSFAKPAADYKIIIEVTSNDAIYALSQAPFTIAPPVSVVSLMTPNGGETLGMGSDFDVRWSCSGKQGFVTLTLLRDDQPLGAIAENLPAAALSYRWRIGAPLLNGTPYGIGGNYRLQILWRVRPVMGKGAMEEGSKGRLAGLAQKNSDRSDGAFSIKEGGTAAARTPKSEKEE